MPGAAAVVAALGSAHSTASPQRESLQQTGVQAHKRLLEAVTPHSPQVYETYNTSYLGGVKAHFFKVKAVKFLLHFSSECCPVSLPLPTWQTKHLFLKQ